MYLITLVVAILFTIAYAKDIEKVKELNALHDKAVSENNKQLMLNVQDEIMVYEIVRNMAILLYGVSLLFGIIKK